LRAAVTKQSGRNFHDDLTGVPSYKGQRDGVLACRLVACRVLA
jgi:hypothetical protein